MKSTIKAVVLSLGLSLFAMGANAAGKPFNTCEEVKEVTEALVVQKVDHERVGEFMNAVDVTAKAINASDYDRKVLLGMAAILVLRERSGELATAPSDFKKACEMDGPEKMAEAFHDIGVKVAID